MDPELRDNPVVTYKDWIAFQNEAHIELISESSVEAVNNGLITATDIQQYLPNIVVRHVEAF
jgi:hypothetical protein